MNDDRGGVTGTQDRGRGFWFAAAGACAAGLVLAAADMTVLSGSAAAVRDGAASAVSHAAGG